MKIKILHHKFLSIHMVQNIKLSSQERSVHLTAEDTGLQDIKVLQKAKSHFRGSCKNVYSP